jgi:hypothetical protein
VRSTPIKSPPPCSRSRPDRPSLVPFWTGTT